MYSECGKKYYLHYNQKLRAKTISGALLFGSAIDQGLNHLLNTKHLLTSIEVFEKAWSFQTINTIYTQLNTATNVVYADKDFDADLLLPEDREKFDQVAKSFNYEYSTLESIITQLKDYKSEKGFENLIDEEKQLYSLAHWLCLRRKGLIMLKSYQTEVLPKIEKVLTVQKNFEIANPEGDLLIGYVDLIVTLKNGENYLLDNKTSSRPYKMDSPKRSQQLVLYYHALKEEYNLKGVGFIVLYKAIKKNKVKICTLCNFDSSETRHKTCPNQTIGNSQTKPIRCNGEFSETLYPECSIDTILNTVPASAEELVLETFDRANEGINKGIFAPNLSACGDFDSDYRCAFYNKCWNNTEKDLVKLDDKK